MLKKVGSELVKKYLYRFTMMFPQQKTQSIETALMSILLLKLVRFQIYGEKVTSVVFDVQNT